MQCAQQASHIAGVGYSQVVLCLSACRCWLTWCTRHCLHRCFLLNSSLCWPTWMPIPSKSMHCSCSHSICPRWWKTHPCWPTSCWHACRAAGKLLHITRCERDAGLCQQGVGLSFAAILVLLSPENVRMFAATPVDCIYFLCAGLSGCLQMPRGTEHNSCSAPVACGADSCCLTMCIPVWDVLMQRAPPLLA